MKKLIVFLMIASGVLFAYLLIAGTGAKYDATSVRYLSSESSVLSGAECSLCFENSTEKPLKFCVYGIFGDERIVGLDEKGMLKSVTIQPYEKQSYIFGFGRRTMILPDDVVIVGEYINE